MPDYQPLEDLQARAKAALLAAACERQNLKENLDMLSMLRSWSRSLATSWLEENRLAQIELQALPREQ